MVDILAPLGAYLLGSVPFAWLLGKTRGIDIRRTGSGNPGATNLGRALGRRWAVAAFVLDYGKGLLPVIAARQYELGATTTALCAIAAIAGHVWTIWLRFRGGKGVATAFGAMTGLAPVASAVAGVLWFALYKATRAVSIASIAAALAFPLGVWTTHLDHPIRDYLPTLLVAILAAGLIIVRHRQNIARLLRGEELRFRGTKEPASAETNPAVANETETNERTEAEA